MAEASPTVARRTLARALKTCRESARIKGANAAAHAGMHAGTLSRIESAGTRIQPGTAQLLMRYYGASEEECRAAFDLAHLARRKGWWRSYKSQPEWLESYLGLETEASVLRDHRSELIPELLQTEQYAFALMSADPAWPSEREVSEGVALRMRRQQRLVDTEPLHLELVMHESALYQVVGGAAVMKEQLRVLRERCDLPNVVCRILPFAVGAYPARYGSFAHITFENSLAGPFSYGDVVYFEHGAGAQYIEDETDTSRYRSVFEDLRSRSLSKDDSRALIDGALTRYE